MIFYYRSDNPRVVTTVKLNIFPAACRGNNAMGDYQGGSSAALPLDQARGLIPRAKSNQFNFIQVATMAR